MKVKDGIERWFKDEKLIVFANEHTKGEFFNLENSYTDPQYEEMARGFGGNNEYIVLMVNCLNYRSHRAKIYKNQRRHERDIWWMRVQLKYEGIYIETCIRYYAKLTEKVEKDIYTTLHREYVRVERNQALSKQ